MPKAPKKPTKDYVLQVRLTKDQRAEIEQAAERAGLDMSAWVRMIALKQAGKS